MYLDTLIYKYGGERIRVNRPHENSGIALFTNGHPLTLGALVTERHLPS
jgi:hypothetical protein